MIPAAAARNQIIRANTLSNGYRTIQSLHRWLGHTAWAPEGREGRSQAGPKGRKLEVGAQRAPRLLVFKLKKKKIIWTSIIPLDRKVDNFLSWNKNIRYLERPFICLDY